MTRLSDEPEIVTLASELGLDWRSNAVTAIVAFCVTKIAKWIKEHGPVATIAELEHVVCERLGLTFEEIREDDDLERIVQKYVAQREYGFAGLRHDFDESTFAAVLRRNNAEPHASDQFVAVVDCRGPKAARAFFSRWHEIAHLLTLPHQRQFTFHRSTTERPPTERLMDEIAGEIGFYDPIFRPAVVDAVRRAGTLTLDVVGEIRQLHCPEASFQATLIACAMRAPIPAIYVEAEMAFKKQELAHIRSGQGELFPTDRPKAKLRARVAVANEAAGAAGLRIDRNMQVPESSVIHELWMARNGSDEPVHAAAIENLADWKHSNGESVGDLDVRVEARRVPDKVIALVTVA